MKLLGKILIVAYIVFLAVMYVGMYMEAVATHRLVQRCEQIEKERRLKEEECRKDAMATKLKFEAEIDAEVRAFMVNEAPAIKQCLDRLQAESVVHKERVEKLRQTLGSLGRDPAQDEDFKRILAYQQELLAEIQNVSNRLITAYIASVKCNAAPSRKGMSELRDNALRDGIDAATSAFSRYEKMKGDK